MKVISNVVSFLRKIEHSIQEFVTDLSVDIDDNRASSPIAAMLKNSPALLYLTLKGVIKGSLQIIMGNPKKAALLFLAYFSPAAIARNSQQSIHAAIGNEDANSILPSTYIGMSTQTRLLRHLHRITLIEEPGSVKVCEENLEKIVELIEELPSSKKHLSVALAHQGFRLHCASPKTIAEKADTNIEELKRIKNLGLALFHPQTETLYFPNVKTELNSPGSTHSLSIFNHELIHAESFYVNQGKCRTTYLSEAHVPVYPVTDKNIKDYDRALKLGENRIEEFARLIQLQENGRINKDSNEAKLLAKYTKAAKSCLTRTWMSGISYDIAARYKEHIKTMQQKDKPTPFIIGTDAGVIEILSLVKDDAAIGAETAVVRHIDPIDTVLSLPFFVEESLGTPLYKDKSPSYLLAEREAYTLQYLSEEAFDVFYKEASKLRQKHLSDCMSEELVQAAQIRQKMM